MNPIPTLSMSAQTGNGLGHMADVASYSTTHTAVAAPLTAEGTQRSLGPFRE